MSTVINGTSVVLMISEDNGQTFSTIGCSTSASVSVNHGTRDTTCKDSGGYSHSGDGLRDMSISGEGLVTYSTVANVDKPNDLFSWLNSRSALFVQLYSSDDYDLNVVGYGYLESYEMEAPLEDNHTYSFGIKMKHEAGMGWADYTATRAKVQGGTSEATGCVRSAIVALKDISIN